MGVFVCDYIARSFVNKTSVSAVTGGVVGGDDLPTGRFLFYHFVCFFLFLSLPRLGRKDVTQVVAAASLPRWTLSSEFIRLLLFVGHFPHNSVPSEPAGNCSNTWINPVYFFGFLFFFSLSAYIFPEFPRL